jgi:hypothetical protein
MVCGTYSQFYVLGELTIESLSQCRDICNCIQNGDDVRRMDYGFVAVVLGVFWPPEVPVAIVESKEFQ